MRIPSGTAADPVLPRTTPEDGASRPLDPSGSFGILPALCLLLLAAAVSLAGQTGSPGPSPDAPPGSWLLSSPAQDRYLLFFRWGPHARALAPPQRLEAFWGEPGNPKSPMGCTLSHSGGALILLWQPRGKRLWQLDLACDHPLTLEVRASHPEGGQAVYEPLGEDLWGRDRQELFLLHTTPKLAWQEGPAPRALFRLLPGKPLQMQLLLADDYPSHTLWPPPPALPAPPSAGRPPRPMPRTGRLAPGPGRKPRHDPHRPQRPHALLG